jgi:hypothetical protein
VASAGAVLVAASPGGPAQDVAGVPAEHGEDQQPEQAQKFEAAERDQFEPCGRGLACFEGCSGFAAGCP